MDNKRSIRKSSKKRNKPRVRFNFWVMFIIFVLSFLTCFILYMLAANFNDDFFEDEFDELPISEEQQPGEDPQDTSEGSQELVDSETEKTEITNPVPQSEAADASYLESCCLVTDQILLDIKNHTDFKDVIGNASLNALNCNETKVVSNYGTVTIYDTIKIKKPADLYLMLGSDIGADSIDEMINSYTTLVSNLHAALPDMKIYIMQLPPVIYDTETASNDKINEYNQRLLDMANSIGVYCIDTNTALKSADGVLEEQYWSAESNSLSEEGYKTICGYILTHTG